MKCLWLAIAVGTAVAGPALAQPNKITAPDWLERPSADEFAEHYPGVAASLEIEGRATIACVVNAQGRLIDCEVTSEAPRDLGFGAAALAMSESFKMRPQMENGVPVEGGEVRIPLRFLLPKAEPAAPPPEASAAALEAGRRAVDALGAVERVIAEGGKVGEDDASTGIPAPVRIAARAAVREAWAAQRGELRDAYARALASVFSEDEMAEIAAFASGPGKDVMKEDKVMVAAMQQIMADHARSAREPARAAFCAKVACPTPIQLEQVWRPADTRDGRIDNPQWSRAPGEYAVTRAAPQLPAVAGLTAAVRLTCRVEKDGELTGCGVDEELPTGLGYGAAAEKLAGAYRLSPVQLAAGAAGRKVTLRVGFAPSDASAPYVPPKPRSAAALELARKLAAANDGVETARRDIEVQILGLESKKPKEADAKTYEALVEAYRVGALKAVETVIENQVRVWAASRTEADLSAMVAFQISAGGRALRERNGAIEVATGKAHMFIAPKITAAARAAFCKDRVCDAAPPAQPTPAKPEPSTRKP